MILALLVSMLLLQVPTLPSQSGVVTGSVKGPDGKAAVGVRVAAVNQPESLTDAATPGAMIRIAETDAEGRYLLDTIPQGRYYIAAGRVDQPTYYPGVREMGRATIVSVMPGITVSGIDFTLNQASAGRATAGATAGVLINPQIVQLSSIDIPLLVRVENGGRVPVSSGGKVTTLRFSGTPVSRQVPLASPSIEAFGPPGDYNVDISYLPPGYFVESITYGSASLTKEPLKLTSADFPPTNPTGGDPTRVLAIVNGILYSAAPSTTVKPARPTSTLIVTLKTVSRPAPTAAEVRIRGQIPQSPVGPRRTVYASGIPGTVYADGTFEIEGLAPGLHTVISLDDPALFGAVVAVGTRDVEGVTLSPISLLPDNVRTARPPEPLGDNRIGATVKVPSVRGQVLDETTQQPLTTGRVRIYGVGQYKDYPIGSDGRFEIPGLFPGTYTLDVASTDHFLVTETVSVYRDDTVLRFEMRRSN
jgi:hypothetical protein